MDYSFIEKYKNAASDNQILHKSTSSIIFEVLSATFKDCIIYAISLLVNSVQNQDCVEIGERVKEDMSFLPKFPLKSLSRENLCNTKTCDILFKNLENNNFDHFNVK